MSLSPNLMKKLAKKGFTLEQIDFIEKEVYMDFKRENGYKIFCGNKLRIIRKVRDSENIYLIKIIGKKDTAYFKEVSFHGCKPPNYDDFQIVINKFFEVYEKLPKGQKNVLVIEDYDLVVDSNVERIDAIRKYISELQNKKDGFEFYNLWKL